MHEVTRIAPLPKDPGLVAYECPACSYVTSVFLPAGRASVMMTPVVPRGRYIGNPPESQSEHFIRDRWLEWSAARVQME
jgi:hypothetical protein